jgi:hypothetical protein
MQTLTPELEKFLKEQGYQYVKEVPGRGVCALSRMFFTVGLLYGLDENGITGRYCYPSEATALFGLLSWDGEGHPLGPWIKHKGPDIEETNPNREDTHNG